MKIGHISDLHWLDTSGSHWFDYLNKRMTGGLNLLLGRAHTHTKDAVRSALSALRAQKIDHLVISGDLTNLALPGEFESVKSMLNVYFTDDEMTIVPGNHDFYTRESAKKHRFNRFIYGDKLPGDIQAEESRIWPFVDLRGDVAIIGLNSAQPRPWFVAAGRLGAVQLSDLRRILALPEVSSRYKIVVLHHHLYQVVPPPGEGLRHLDDRKELLQICMDGGVDLIAHGHNHDFTQKRVENVCISEAGSCSVSTFKRDNRAGKMNIYHIENHVLQSVQTWRYIHEDYELWQTSDPDKFECADLKALQ